MAASMSAQCAEGSPQATLPVSTRTRLKNCFFNNQLKASSKMVSVLVGDLRLVPTDEVEETRVRFSLTSDERSCDSRLTTAWRVGAFVYVLGGESGRGMVVWPP
eukprot:gb/GEZN01015431.1/.p1 GENE.gb/GEZN01015431.1/~~gb/GEZN01015431.1/.p1  ORF type:complete len:104 (-),score=5.09 gb/GEZN01015431.1/:531-842(-)